jgi:hypothetical protein
MQTHTDQLPFALRYHQPTDCDPSKVLGEPEQEWTWEPKGDIKPEDLKIYASGGNSTSSRTGNNQWDHGEFY